MFLSSLRETEKKLFRLRGLVRERERERVFRFVGKNRCDGGRIKIIKENFKKI